MFSKERVLYYARVAGWTPEKLIDLFCAWFDLDESDQHDLDFEQFLVSKLTDEQLEQTLRDAM